MVIKFALVMQCLGPAEAIQRCSLALQADATRSQRDTPRLGGHHCHLLPHISVPEKAHSGFITHIYGFPATQVLLVPGNSEYDDAQSKAQLRIFYNLT